MTERVDIAIVGGGPSGALVAAGVAQAGRSVVVFERAPSWRWRAGGVFASPAAVTALRRAGVDPAVLEVATRAIPAMRVVTRAATTFRLTYGSEAGGASAVGFDRSVLDPALLARAADAGADVRAGWTVVAVDPRAATLRVRRPDGVLADIAASVIVGADGPGSVVARAAGVHRAVWLPPRVGVSWHVADPLAGTRTSAIDGRMQVIRDGYVGIAPVPGDRRNIGIVLGPSWAGPLRRDGASATVVRALATVPPATDGASPWAELWPLDTIAGASPLGSRVTRRAGVRWLLVGDAAGFLDPFTGEGLHRAFVSADLAVRAIVADGHGRRAAFAAYDRAMARRFTTKDLVSWLVQLALIQPRVFEHAARRVAAHGDVRGTMGLVMGDLIPAGRALDPRFLAALFAP